MIDVQKVNATKNKILEVIKNAGPSFPTRISREAGISPLFIGALLSEMLSEKKLVMSAMKVGSSPLYYMIGQEPLLENFTQYLNHKEREAVTRLKEGKILDDELQDPAIRVALRKIKDFAIPITVSQDGVEKLYWKYFTTSDEEAKNLLEPPAPKTLVKERIERVQEKEMVTHVEPEEPKRSEKKSKKEKKPSLFALSVKEYLSAKEMELLEELPTKAKEYNAKVRMDTLLGKQEILVLAREKKKITEDDLAIALHRAQSEKMPALILTPGDLDKAAKPYLETWKNLLKVERLNR